MCSEPPLCVRATTSPIGSTRSLRAEVARGVVLAAAQAGRALLMANARSPVGGNPVPTDEPHGAVEDGHVVPIRANH